MFKVSYRQYDQTQIYAPTASCLMSEVSIRRRKHPFLLALRCWGSFARNVLIFVCHDDFDQAQVQRCHHNLDAPQHSLVLLLFFDVPVSMDNGKTGQSFYYPCCECVFFLQIPCSTGFIITQIRRPGRGSGCVFSSPQHVLPSFASLLRCQGECQIYLLLEHSVHHRHERCGDISRRRQCSFKSLSALLRARSLPDVFLTINYSKKTIVSLSAYYFHLVKVTVTVSVILNVKLQRIVSVSIHGIS